MKKKMVDYSGGYSLFTAPKVEVKKSEIVDDKRAFGTGGMRAKKKNQA